MKIVIDIPKEKYQTIINHAEEILDESSFIEPKYLYVAVLNGTPLPEGAEILTKEARENKAVMDAVDRVTTKECPDRFGKDTNATTTDAVDRQAVLEIFGYVMDYWKEHAIDVEPHEIEDAIIEQYEFTAKQINELQPVTPQPKMGKWIDGKCNKCGREALHWELTSSYYYSEYCPYCGADMRDRCKDCKYFEYDSAAKVDGIPLIVAHEICKRWGNGCKTKEDGYCFLFEPKM